MVDHGRSDASTGVSPVLVGRDDALALLARRWSEVRESSRGHLMLIAGEAGIGKTRLLAELCELSGVDAQAIRAGAFARDSDVAGGTILDIADGFLRAGMAEAAKALRERLSAPQRGGDAAQRRRMLVGDLVDVLLDALHAEPAMLLVEDVQWADELSLDVIARLAPALPGTASLVVATLRSDELRAATALSGWRASLVAGRLAEELRLTRLSADEVTSMVTAITGHRPSSQLAASLLRRSDGIPLHVEELLRVADAAAVPDTIAAAIAGRISALDSGSRAVLEAAAVIGRTFDIDMLGEVAEAPGPVLDEAIGELLSSQLLVPARDGGAYSFRHALIADAAYELVAPYRRRQLHEATGRAELRHGGKDGPVSEHFERAANHGSAHAIALRGAREASRLSGHREAAGLFGRALRTAPADLPTGQRAALHADLAVELLAVDDSGAAAQNLAHAIELFREHGDDRAAALLVPRLMAAQHLLGVGLEPRASMAEEALRDLRENAPDFVRAALLAALATTNMLDRRLDEAIDLAERASALASGGEQGSLRIDINLTLGAVLVFAGRAEEGWQLLESSVSASDAAGAESETARGYRMIGTSAPAVAEYERASEWLDRGLSYCRRTERWNDYYYMLAHRAVLRWCTGDWLAAESDGRDALANGRGITTRITALTALGHLALGRRDLDAARVLLTEALRSGESMAELQRISPALWGLAELALHEGDAVKCLALCADGLEASKRVSDAAYLFPFVITATRAHLGLRQVVHARAWLEQCRVLLVRRGIPGSLPALDHAEGLIQLAEGRTGAARTLLESAQSGWLSVGRHWESHFALVDLAQCAARSRRPADAGRLLLQATQGAAATGFALLAHVIDSAAARTAVDAGPLSPRELEVARLVAGGETNRGIAQALSISPKTASAHIEHILVKLGVARRAEIAAWISRREG